MSDPFLGAIKMIAFTFTPRGYADCSGDLIGVAGQEALFSLLGTLYGGDGRTVFGLPDLRGRVPVHRTATHVQAMGVVNQGQRGGLNEVVLTTAELPSHDHAWVVSQNGGSAGSPGGTVLGAEKMYTNDTTDPVMPLYDDSVDTIGDGEAHDNMMPFTGIRFSIAMNGAYPQRN